MLWLHLDFVLSGQTLFGQNQESHGVNLESLNKWLAFCSPVPKSLNVLLAVQNIRLRLLS